MLIAASWRYKKCERIRRWATSKPPTPKMPKNIESNRETRADSIENWTQIARFHLRTTAPPQKRFDENSQFLCIFTTADWRTGTWNNTRDAPICTRNKRKREKLTKRKIICSEMENVWMHVWRKNSETACTTSPQKPTNTHMEKESDADSRSNYTYFVLRLYRRRMPGETSEPNNRQTLNIYAIYSTHELHTSRRAGENKRTGTEVHRVHD